MNQDKRALFENQAPKMHSLSDQQLKDVSGGAIVPCGSTYYGCTSCTFSKWSCAALYNCPKCGAPLKALDYCDDEPSLD